MSFNHGLRELIGWRDTFTEVRMLLRGETAVCPRYIIMERGFTDKRLQALTVIRNYGIKHSNGSTAVSRLFGQESPDPLTWLLEQIGERPLPRRSKKRAIYNPLILLTVPS